MTNPAAIDNGQSLQEGRQRLRDILLEKSVRTDREFTLASGRTSNFYVDVRKTSLDPEGAFWIGRLFGDLLNNYPDVVAVGGPTLGADPLTSATSVVSWIYGRHLPGFIIRKEAKGHGTGQWLEGPELNPGDHVVLLEDVVTTGGSALQAAGRLRDHGVHVDSLFAVVDREEGGAQAIADAGLKLERLFGKQELLDAS